MRTTDRQDRLLANLDQITSSSKRSGLPGYFLAGEDVTGTVNSMLVKGLVRPSLDRNRLVPTKAI